MSRAVRPSRWPELPWGGQIGRSGAVTPVGRESRAANSRGAGVWAGEVLDLSVGRDTQVVRFAFHTNDRVDDQSGGAVAGIGPDDS